MLAAAAAVALLAVAATRADDRGGAPNLEGGYTIVAGEKFGKKLSEEEVKGHTVRFTADKVVVTDKNKQEVYVATYKLDEGRKPSAITMTALIPRKGDVARGIIAKDGDTVRLIYSLPGAEPPTEFRTGPQQLMFIMKNSNK